MAVRTVGALALADQLDALGVPESARWSNWPGRNSAANTCAPSAWGSSVEATSTWGSLNTVGTALIEQLLRDALHVVAVHQAQTLEAR